MKTTGAIWARWAGIGLAVTLLAGPVTVMARDDGYRNVAGYQTQVRYREYDDHHDRHRSRHYYRDDRHRHYGHAYGRYSRPACPLPPRYGHRSYYTPRYYDRGYGTWDFSLNYRYRD